MLRCIAALTKPPLLAMLPLWLQAPALRCPGGPTPPPGLSNLKACDSIRAEEIAMMTITICKMCPKEIAVLIAQGIANAERIPVAFAGGFAVPQFNGEACEA